MYFVLKMIKAELLWIKSVQFYSFGREIHFLNFRISQFGLYLDEQQV